MRRTGWVYAKANRVPRAVQEVLACSSGSGRASS